MIMWGETPSTRALILSTLVAVETIIEIRMNITKRVASLCPVLAKYLYTVPGIGLTTNRYILVGLIQEYPI